jgi:hypothetical protein
MLGKRAEERIRKANFIMHHFENVKKLDPVFSYKEVREIREKMIEHGLYSSKQDMELVDSSIINIIRFIQNGKMFTKNHTVKRSKSI